MKICTLSDSHDRSAPLARAVREAAAQGAQAALHCGDVIGANALRAALECGITLHAVHGNNLGDPFAVTGFAVASHGRLAYYDNDARAVSNWPGARSSWCTILIAAAPSPASANRSRSAATTITAPTSPRWQTCAVERLGWSIPVRSPAWPRRRPMCGVTTHAWNFQLKFSMGNRMSGDGMNSDLQALSTYQNFQGVQREAFVDSHSRLG